MLHDTCEKTKGLAVNREEALRILGLDENATVEDVKAAYKETVQILHPDRFSTNKKLQARATEQFKNLQEAYDLLTKGGAEDAGGSSSGKGKSGKPSARTARELEARLAGIAAARTQLVAQRDSLYDNRRNALMLMVGGALLALFLRRIPAIAAVGTGALIWGLVSMMSISPNIKTIESRLKELAVECKKIERKLEDLG